MVKTLTWHPLPLPPPPPQAAHENGNGNGRHAAAAAAAADRAAPAAAAAAAAARPGARAALTLHLACSDGFAAETAVALDGADCVLLAECARFAIPHLLGLHGAFRLPTREDYLQDL